MKFKPLLAGLLAAAVVIGFNWHRMLLYTVLWRGFLAGAGVGLAIVFADRAVNIFVKTERTADEGSSGSPDLANQEIMEEEPGEEDDAEPEQETVEPEDTGGAGPEESVSGPSEVTGDTADTSGGEQAESGEALDEESAGEIADVISDTIDEE